jgi:hypothetical protein
MTMFTPYIKKVVAKSLIYDASTGIQNYWTIGYIQFMDFA